MLSKLRSAYAWALLSALMLPLLPIARIFAAVTRKRDPRGDRLRTFMASWISLYGRWTPLYRFCIEGRQHLPASGPYVLVANHESGLDVLCLQMLRIPARFLAEHWLFEVPLSGPLFHLARHVPVEVGNRESGRLALVAAEDALRDGSPVAIFPEGILSPDEMKPFKPGAFVLAQRAKVPIVPVRIVGTGAAWRPGTLVVEGAHRIRIVILPPIPASEVEARDAGTLAAATRERLLAVAPGPGD
ncbi:MAG: lysophospholipid acyltransferase family protein [Myxococcota bacterium]